MSNQQPTFDPNNLPERPTAIFDDAGNRIGTFNPHTLIIHPMGSTIYGPMKLLGQLVFDMKGNLIGKFNAAGCFSPTQVEEVAI